MGIQKRQGKYLFEIDEDRTESYENLAHRKSIQQKSTRMIFYSARLERGMNSITSSRDSNPPRELVTYN
jgi:hypothetical protein